MSWQEAHIGNHRCHNLTKNNCFNETSVFCPRAKRSFYRKLHYHPTVLGKRHRNSAHLMSIYMCCSNIVLCKMGLNITPLTFLKGDRKNSATVISWMTSVVSPYVWSLGAVLIWLVASVFTNIVQQTGDKKDKAELTLFTFTIRHYKKQFYFVKINI